YQKRPLLILTVFSNREHIDPTEPQKTVGASPAGRRLETTHPFDLAADLWPLTSGSASSTLRFRATRALSLCLHQSPSRGQSERILRGERLGRSIQSVERGSCRPRTCKARGTRLHIELSRSMRHWRYCL